MNKTKLLCKRTNPTHLVNVKIKLKVFAHKK